MEEEDYPPVPKIYLSEEEIQEFKIEAEELLETAENSLLALEKGAEFSKNYDAIFRAFHSVKGAAGMLNWGSLQHHMHLLENHFQQCQGEAILSRVRVTYFLDGIDASRKILNLQEVEFIYEMPPNSEGEKDAFSESLPQLSEPEIPIQVPRPIAGSAKVTATPIFVLDDEPDIVEILTEILSEGGYEVFGFTDAEEALKAVPIKKPQAFFSDMNMPNLSGLEVLRAVHCIDAEIPLMFVSAHLSKEILIESLSYGVYAAIEKPFNRQQILAIAKSATRKFQLWMLLNRSINFVMYQFSALDAYLVEKGMTEIRNMMVKEMQVLLDVRRELREGHEGTATNQSNKAS